MALEFNNLEVNQINLILKNVGITRTYAIH